MMHEAMTADGTLLRFRRHGLADAPKRLLLIHSLAMTGQFWDLVVERLGKDYQVVCPDCRGHGDSARPAGPYTVETFADDMAAIMDAVGWRSAHVAGASMGGCVALAFAGRHPERLEGLGLIDTTAWYGESAPQDWAGRADKARAEGLASLVAFQQTRWFGDAFRAAHPEVVAESVRIFLANDIDAYDATCRMLGHCDQRHVMAGLRVPVEIVVGSEDYATPVAMAEAMQRAIPGARLQVLEGRRHLTPLEDPEAVAAALRRLTSR